MAQNSRELVKSLFDGKPTERPVFMPWVCSFAAKLEQVPVKSMFDDPGILTRALSNAQKLFKYDVILNHFNPTLEAEALGCEIEWQNDNWPPVIISHPLEDGMDFYDLDTENIENKGRIPVILEATKRLILTKGKEVPIAAMVTGPLTLANSLKGSEFAGQLEEGKDEALDLVEDAGGICLKLCKVYFELGADIIVIAEDLHNLVIPDVLSVLASPLKSIFNVVRFYEKKSVLISKERSDEQGVSMCKLGADAVSISGNIDAVSIKEKAGDKNCRFSITIPDLVFSQLDSENIRELIPVEKSAESGIFLTSEWELPRDTDVNNMHQIMKTIRDE